ncbi:NmrA family protein [Xylaria palmicola]|nr:NmrA family protein [Xylaria palmicola]
MATYLITQATGNQSQWTIRHLLAAGAKVHALVRDPSKVLPEVLRSPGVTIFKGESVNFDDVFQAAQGCAGVFLNTVPIPELESKQARTIVEAARKAGVATVVASTAMCAGRRDMWDDDFTAGCGLRGYYLSKAAVEDAVRGAGFAAWTILRPAYLHIDYQLPSAHHNFPRLATHGELDHYFDDGARMGQTDTSDVGRFAAAALQDPARFGGHELEIAAESLTVEEIRDVLVRVSGRDVGVRRRTPEDGEPVFGQLFQVWANKKDLGPIIAASKEAAVRFGIPLTSLEDALQREKGRLLECLPVKA